MELLIPHTTAKLGKALSLVSREQVRLTGSIVELVEKASNDGQAVREGLEAACEFGAAPMVERLLVKVEEDLPEEFKQKLLKLAVEADSPKTCKAILALVSVVAASTITVAEERGNSEVLQIVRRESEGEANSNAMAKGDYGGLIFH